MVCKKCGQEYDDNMNFCPNCGFKKDGELKEKKNIDYKKLVDLLNIVFFGFAMLFTFVWLMVYSNQSSITTFLALTSLGGIFSTFYLVTQSLSFLFAFTNKEKKLELKDLIIFIMLLVVALVLFITNWVYLSIFAKYNSIFGSFY